MTINEAQDEIVDEFSAYDEWMDKYSLLIELGNDMPPYPEEHRKPEYIIEGCQSTVWIYCEQNADGPLSFKGDSAAIRVKGSVALWLKEVAGPEPAAGEEADV